MLLSFSTGLFSVGEGSVDKINCDKVKSVGIMMQEKLDGRIFTEDMETLKQRLKTCNFFENLLK